MTLTKQSGFSAVEVILIVVIVGVLGFVGWRVYQANTEVATIQDKADNSTVGSTYIPSTVAKIEKTNDLTDLEKSIDSINVEGNETYELNSQLSF